ncbi:MAG: hypothetical protein PHC50_00660 [Candidatus Cloacimonetes bacterium]|nr:hypothetical protein [Candidatus Cloacimonadota bacterium]
MEDISLIFQNLVELQKQDPTAPKRGRRDRRGKPIVNYSDTETQAETPAQEPVQETYEKYMEAALKEVSTNPNLSFLKLSKLDIEIIAEQFGYFIRGRIEACDLECLRDKESAKDLPYLKQAKFLLSLYERGLMIASDRRDEALDIVSICEVNTYLNPYLKAVLLGVDCYGSLKALLEPDYIGQYPGMQYVSNYLDLLMRYLDEGECKLISAGNIIRYYLELLWDSIEASPEDSSLKAIIRDFGMDKLDFLVCSLLYRASKNDHDYELPQIAAYLGRNSHEREQLRRGLRRRYLMKENRMMQAQRVPFRRRSDLELKGELYKRFELSEGFPTEEDEDGKKLIKQLLEDGDGLLAW